MGFTFAFDSAWGSIAAALVGAALFGTLLRHLLDQRASRSWPRVEGRVVDTRVLEGPSDDFVVEFKYEYKVGERTFRGSEQLDGTLPTQLIASAKARDRLGRRLDVAYDPDDPGHSTLDPGETTGAGAALFIVGGILGVGLWFVWKWWAHAG